MDVKALHQMKQVVITSYIDDKLIACDVKEVPHETVSAI